MNLGFNSKIQVGDGLYHVQTEDRGATHPFIDTVVLLQGQVLHRRSTSYQDLLPVGAEHEDALRSRVEQQHRDILEGLRTGSLPLDKVPPVAAPAVALDIRLRNSNSWLNAGYAALDVEVCGHGTGEPLVGAEVIVSIEAPSAPTPQFTACTDAEGHAWVRFQMPHLAHPDAAVLVIHARAGQMQSRIRYHLKPKPQDFKPIPR